VLLVIRGIGTARRAVRSEGFSASVSRHHLELDTHAGCEILGVSIEHGGVQKHILAAVLRRDEPIAAIRVKLQNPARNQRHPPSVPVSPARSARTVKRTAL